MIYGIFRNIKNSRKELIALKKALGKCKNVDKKKLLEKRIDELEVTISFLKKTTDAFLANHVTDIDKEIIIDHYYNGIKWEVAVTLHVTYLGDYNPDSYRRYIHRLLSKY